MLNLTSKVQFDLAAVYPYILRLNLMLQSQLLKSNTEGQMVWLRLKEPIPGAPKSGGGDEPDPVGQAERP